MALTVGNQYLASEFNALKTRVKAEMARRKYAESLESFAGTTYDYTITPTIDETVLAEHLNKLVVPLNAINDTGITTVTAGDAIQSINALNTFLTTSEGYSITGATTNCRSSCTGLCTSGCGSTCTGCSGTCTGSCSGGCSGCGGNCTGKCYGCKGCSGGCSGCAGTCKGSCKGSCSNACTNSCTRSGE